MTTNEIRTILDTNTFGDPKDRLYWERKLQEAEQKEETAAENAKYFRQMAVYDR